jgi:hypothetical protein
MFAGTVVPHISWPISAFLWKMWGLPKAAITNLLRALFIPSFGQRVGSLGLPMGRKQAGNNPLGREVGDS